MLQPGCISVKKKQENPSTLVRVTLYFILNIYFITIIIIFFFLSKIVVFRDSFVKRLGQIMDVCAL